MKKIFAFLGLTTAMFVSAVQAQTLIAGWDFQTTTNGGTAVAAAPSTPTAFIANFGSGTLFLNGSNGSSTWLPATELTAFAGTTTNASNGLSTVTTSPAALAVLGGTTNSANGKAAVFKFSLAGFTNLSITFAGQRTAAGFNSQLWEWSTDGTSYNSIGTILSNTTTGTLTTSFASSGVLGFNNVSGLDNATDAYVRVTFTGATAASGNNRLDNFQFVATAVPEPSTYAMLALSAAGLGGYVIRRRRR
jgi:hypothetical protein